MKWNMADWGMLVEATPLVVSQGIAKEGQRGLLLGRCGTLVKVVKRGTTTSVIYSAHFWQQAFADPLPHP